MTGFRKNDQNFPVFFFSTYVSTVNRDPKLSHVNKQRT